VDRALKRHNIIAILIHLKYHLKYISY